MDGLLIFGTVANLTGTFSTFIDLYYNIKKYYLEVDIKLYLKEKEEKFLMMIYSNVGREGKILGSKYKGKKVESEVLITSTKVFYDIKKEGLGIEIKCKKMILLDTWEIYKMWVEGILEEVVEDILKSCEELYFLGNKFNLGLMGVGGVEYYHKFSKERLEWLYTGVDNGKIYYRDEKVKEGSKIYYKTKNDRMTYKEIFECSEYHYMRWYGFENIGKMIFEFLWMGKKVKYYLYDKLRDDGLTEYMRLFGVDDNVGGYLDISKEEIEDKLFMKEEDEILGILRKVWNG